MYQEYSSESFEQKFTYSGTDLGASWSAQGTFFRLWAPTAQWVKICLYRSGNLGESFRQIPMERGERGTWTASAQGDLNAQARS